MLKKGRSQWIQLTKKRWASDALKMKFIGKKSSNDEKKSGSDFMIQYWTTWPKARGNGLPRCQNGVLLVGSNEVFLINWWDSLLSCTSQEVDSDENGPWAVGQFLGGAKMACLGCVEPPRIFATDGENSVQPFSSWGGGVKISVEQTNVKWNILNQKINIKEWATSPRGYVSQNSLG